MKDIANMNVPPHFKHLSGSDGILFGVSTLHKLGIPYTDSLEAADTLPSTCTCCSTVILGPETDTLTRAQRLWLWQAHMARCGGPGGRWLQVHDVLKLGLKHLILCHSEPGGTLAPGDRVDYELSGLQTDASKPGDVYRRMLGALRDIAMDVCIASCTKKTGLTDAADNPDHIQPSRRRSISLRRTTNPA